MLEALRRKREEEEGFTLIELMVVVLIIAILIAIAIPTFLGAQNRARDRAAQSDLRNALSAAKTLATDYEGYFKRNNTGTGCGGSGGDPIDAAALTGVEGSLSFVAGDTVAPSTNVGFAVVNSSAGVACGAIQMMRISASNEIFALKADQSGAVTYCRGSGTSTTSSCTLSKW